MVHLRWIVHQDIDLVRSNGTWMGVNTALAVFPAALAVFLFPRRGRKSWAWLFGVVVFALFLPNAPYVVTDLIHLRDDVTEAPTDGVVVAGVLPLYTAFIGVGFLAYLFAMDRIVEQVAITATRIRRWQVELTVHAACAAGIVIGRVARLNSWDTITHPTDTLERSFASLTFRGAPVAIVLVFVAVVVTYSLVRVVVMAVGGALDRLAAAIRERGSTEPV